MRVLLLCNNENLSTVWMPETGNPQQENLGKIIEGNFPSSIGNLRHNLPSKNLALWPSASASPLHYASCLTSSLWLVSDEVLLPSAGWESSSLTLLPDLWNWRRLPYSTNQTALSWALAQSSTLPTGITWPSCCCLSRSGKLPSHHCPCPSLTASISSSLRQLTAATQEIGLPRNRTAQVSSPS